MQVCAHGSLSLSLTLSPPKDLTHKTEVRTYVRIKEASQASMRELQYRALFIWIKSCPSPNIINSTLLLPRMIEACELAVCKQPLYCTVLHCTVPGCLALKSYYYYYVKLCHKRVHPQCVRPALVGIMQFAACMELAPVLPLMIKKN